MKNLIIVVYNFWRKLNFSTKKDNHKVNKVKEKYKTKVCTSDLSPYTHTLVTYKLIQINYTNLRNISFYKLILILCVCTYILSESDFKTEWTNAEIL